MMLGRGGSGSRVLGGRLFRHSASSSPSLRRNDLSVRVANSNKTRKGPSFFDEADVDAPVMRRRDNADPLKDDTPMWKQNYRPHFDKLDEETDRLLNGTEEEESEFAAAMRKRDEAKAAGNGLGFVDIETQLDNAFSEGGGIERAKEQTQTPAAKGKPRAKAGSTSLPDVFDPRTRRLRVVTRNDLFGSGKGKEVTPEVLEKMQKSGQNIYYAPTKRERAAWKKNDKYAINYVADAEELMLENKLRAEEAERKRLAYMAEYQALKGEFLLATATTGILTVAIVYTSVGFKMDLTVSAALGAIGAFTYSRFLTQSADGSSPPRLAVPLVLCMGWNRWEALFADDVGFHLSLLYMSIGFFTYKGSNVWQVIRAFLPIEDPEPAPLPLPTEGDATSSWDEDALSSFDEEGRAKARTSFDKIREQIV